MNDRAHGWTHPQCSPCWEAAEGSRVPHRKLNPEQELCCWCGRLTTSGIYQRENPAALRCCPDRAGKTAE